jgi:hypothetical protein
MCVVHFQYCARNFVATHLCSSESDSMRRSVFGFVLGFAHVGVGVDDPGVDTADNPMEVADDERE